MVIWKTSLSFSYYLSIMTATSCFFGSDVDAHHLEQVVGLCIVYFVTTDCNQSCMFWALFVFPHYLVNVLY